jgi:hypothetical protein
VFVSIIAFGGRYFVDIITLEISTRVLDCFFYEGRVVFFKVGLAIFKLKEKELLNETEGNKIVNMMKMGDTVSEEILKVILSTVVLTLGR